MDLKQLAYFVQVADFGSFTRASVQLGVAQPALSRQVRQLEIELRQPLFERNGRGVTLTVAGKRLLEHARGILAQAERAKTDLDEHRDAAAGPLAIGLPPSVGRALTGDLVLAFRQQFPKATLSIVEGLSSNLLEWLAVGRLDCAVAYNVAASAEFERVAVLDEPLYLVSRAGEREQARIPVHGVGWTELAAVELVMPRRPNALRILIENALAAQGLRAHVGMEIDSVPAILDLLARSALHGVLSRNAVRSSGRAQDYHLQRIGAPPLTAPLSIVTSARRPAGPLVERAAALLREMLLAQRDDAPDRVSRQR